MSRSWFIPLALVAVQSLAAEGFDPAKDIAISFNGGVLSVTMPPGAHLKMRTFKIALVTQGTLKLSPFPPATGEDEAGDPIWRGTVNVALRGKGLETPARLLVSYQPCTEGPQGVCYLPQKRTITVAASEFPSPRP
jgi:thiol:disulfide interchange protein DsbD